MNLAFPFLRRPLTRRAIITSVIVLLYIIVFAATIALLNGGLPNRILTPLPQYYSLFSVLWDENAWAALQLIITKSFFVITHNDARSGLNLWTLEIDSISFIVYMLTAWILSTILLSQHVSWKNPHQRWVKASAVVGSLLIFFSISYMSVIDHCAGATWTGFVSAYGMGASAFELYPVYQIVTGLGGCALLVLSVYNERKQRLLSKSADDVDSQPKTAC